MADYIICFTANGGIPLFSRSCYGSDPQSFPVMGSLNGIHLFAKNKDVSLISTLTSDRRVVWKTFQDSLVLIAFFGKSSGTSDKSLQSSKDSTVSDAHFIRLLDNVFHSLVLLIGLEDLCSTSNIDRLKRDLRITYKVLDSFLVNDTLVGGCPLFGDLSQSADTAMCNEATVLQESLNNFVSSAESTYGCLIGAGKIICATEKWWMLTGTELALLLKVISFMSSSSTSCDIPVYLPHSSPNIPHRLLLFNLISSASNSGGVKVCVLCGPTPSLAEVQQKLIESVWNPAVDILQRCIPACITGFPADCTDLMPVGLMAFLLINRDTPHCISSTNPFNKSNVTSEIMHNRGKLLTEFYMSVIGTTFPLPNTIESDESCLDLSKQEHDSFDCYALAHYQCFTTHKCFAIRSGSHQLFTIFNSETPTFALQDLSEKILRMLVVE